MNNQTRGKTNKTNGVRAENIAIAKLKELGFVLVERIETGRRFNGSWVAPVSGDIHAIEQGTGRAVLCEVKSRPKKLLYSALEKHQHKSLQIASDAGAIALLAWHSDDGLVIMQYPIIGFKAGTSLKYNTAKLHEWI